ncbi:MAG: alpha/beta fold hydrolase [Stenotrophobium sp.]
MKSLPTAILLAITAMLAGCITIGDADDPIASILVPATQPAAQHPLVVVLPGFGADDEDMQKHDIGAAIHETWPQADVLLTSATFAYYTRRNIVQRLDDDVITPARQKGYQQIWLAGASVGGMGVLFYEYAHPGAMTGLILLAPWLGSSDLQKKIRDAGGVRQWDPGPVPAVVDNDNYQQEMWRVIKRWSEDPAAAQRVWMICGADDRMLKGDQLLATALAPSHFMVIPGSHNWETFLRAASLISAQINQPAAENPPPP